MEMLKQCVAMIADQVGGESRHELAKGEQDGDEVEEPQEDASRDLHWVW
jgi:hypothetical protein